MFRRERVHELTGPRLLTFDEVAAELTGATGNEAKAVRCGGS
ncbi:hypothetical protein [Streptomyces atroolivaceus]